MPVPIHLHHLQRDLRHHTALQPEPLVAIRSLSKRRAYPAHQREQTRRLGRALHHLPEVVHGSKGVVTGPHAKEPDTRVRVLFPGNKGTVGCRHTQLRRTPLPLPSPDASEIPADEAKREAAEKNKKKKKGLLEAKEYLHRLLEDDDARDLAELGAGSREDRKGCWCLHVPTCSKHDWQ